MKCIRQVFLGSENHETGKNSFLKNYEASWEENHLTSGIKSAAKKLQSELDSPHYSLPNSCGKTGQKLGPFHCHHYLSIELVI